MELMFLSDNNIENIKNSIDITDVNSIYENFDRYK